MIFRYFDVKGKQLTIEQLYSMQVSTPVMNHVFATVLERVGNSGKEGSVIEKEPLK